jgi:hypothetical protein
MNILLRIMLVGLGTVSMLGLANDNGVINIQIKNKSSQKVEVIVRNKMSQVVVSNEVQSNQALELGYDLKFLDHIVINYLAKDNRREAYKVTFNTKDRKFDKVYLKFKLDTGKNGAYIPSLQPQEGTVFSRRTTLKNNIKKTDMTPEDMS